MTSKYDMGEHFESLDELMRWAEEGKSVFFCSGCRNAAWVMSQQARFLYMHLWAFRKTKAKEKESNG